jgi:hypothetical protein
MDVHVGHFVWDRWKERANLRKHGMDFCGATAAFRDPRRQIFVDSKHSGGEARYFCVGRIGERIVTVRFTYRGAKIRIFGAGEWRKGRKLYEEENC